MATVRSDGSPHVVPFVFVLLRDGAEVRLYWAVDEKPKRSTTLRRVENLRTNPGVEVVLDGYHDDWDALWWVRMRGDGRIVSDHDERERALAALAAKYVPYRSMELVGDVVAIDVDRISWWAADEDRR